jgi:hypothetical protein
MAVTALSGQRWQGSSTSTQIQGYAGGLGTYSADYAGGGGGGATTTGFAQDANSIGGTGIANSITGSEVGQLDSGTYYFSGGGGGGKSGSSNTCLGGLGGGGAGGSTSATDGTVNTGGGGGAHSSSGNAGAGGSGVVLVTYKTSEITDDSSDGSLESGSSIPSGYAIRKFTSSGANTFSISAGSGNVQYVVVAGGGSGGSGGGSGSDYGGGGGGAGGFLTGTKSMSAGDYTVTVGAGGSATNAHGNDGNNSVFDDITSTTGGGGAGSADANKNGNNGGSGGGASRAGTVGTGASTITDEKTLVTDVPAGSEFEQTNDYKSYQYGGMPDGLGSSADGTNTNVTLDTTNEKLGTGCLDFDGSAYISSSGRPDFQIGDSFSVSFWFKTTSTSFTSIINQWGTQNGGSNNGWSFIDSGTAISFRFSSSWSGDAIRVNTSTDSAFSDGNWHHLVMTYDGSGYGGVIFYLDGAVKSSSADLTGTVGSITYGLGLAVGAISGVWSDKYTGTLDDIGIWNTVLPIGTDEDTAGSVKWLYNTGTGRLASTIPSDLLVYYNCDSATVKNNAVGWVERGTAI